MKANKDMWQPTQASKDQRRPATCKSQRGPIEVPKKKKANLGPVPANADQRGPADRTGICLGTDMTISAYYFGIFKIIMHPF